MTHLQNSYDPILVLFSFLVAIVASSSALTCLNRMRSDLFALVTVVVPLLANAVIPAANEDFQAQQIV